MKVNKCVCAVYVEFEFVENPKHINSLARLLQNENECSTLTNTYVHMYSVHIGSGI